MVDNQEEKFKILVVDDNAENVEFLRELLTKSGYEISTAYNGEEALQKVNKGIPDLILLDIMMPKMDGYQVCEVLREKEETKDIPIIFVTAKTEVKDWTHAIFNVGVNSYITKPFSLSNGLFRPCTGIDVVGLCLAAQQVHRHHRELAAGTAL